MCVAGAANATLIAPSIHGSISEEYPLSLDVSGMCELGRHRSAHVSWLENLRLNAGDSVRFAFSESQHTSPPARIKPTDSLEHIEEQCAFDELRNSLVPDRTPMARTRPQLAFECVVNGTTVAVARFNEAEEHILCGVYWDAWNPDRCRVYVRSFGDESRPERAEATEWLRANLALGDVLDVHVAA